VRGAAALGRPCRAGAFRYPVGHPTLPRCSITLGELPGFWCLLAVAPCARSVPLDRCQRDTLPRLGTVKLSEIVEATGLSKSCASQVRAEKFTPHVSTWRTFDELVGVTQPARYAR